MFLRLLLALYSHITYTCHKAFTNLIIASLKWRLSSRKIQHLSLCSCWLGCLARVFWCQTNVASIHPCHSCCLFRLDKERFCFSH